MFLAHGFTVKEGQTDLKEYVYQAAEVLLSAWMLDQAKNTDQDNIESPFNACMYRSHCKRWKAEAQAGDSGGTGKQSLQVEQSPAAYLVDGWCEEKLISHALYFTVDEAKKTASVFAQHYPSVHTMALYTAPPKREPLTDEQIEEICWTEVDQRLRSFARAIEAAHGITK